MLAVINQFLTICVDIAWACINDFDFGLDDIYIISVQVGCFFFYIYSMGIIYRFTIMKQYEIQIEANLVNLDQDANSLFTSIQ